MRTIAKITAVAAALFMYVNAHAQLIVDVGNDTTVCAGSIINANVSGGTPPYNYVWATGATTQAINVSIGGTYSVTVTDDLGAIAIDSVIVVVNPNPVIDSIVTTDVSCYGLMDGAIEIRVIGGVPNYIYGWSHGQTTRDISNLLAGNYIVTVTDANGCAIFGTITVNQPAPLVIDTIVTTDISCFGAGDGSACAVVSGGNLPYNFAWSNNGTASCTNNLAHGNSRITVVDANGCMTDVSFTINEPAPLEISSVTTTNVKCNGGNDGTACVYVTGGVSGYLYLWNTGAIFYQCHSNLSSGTYSVTIQDGNGCSVASSAITIYEPAPLVIDSIITTDVSCYGGSDGSACVYVSGGTLAYFYSWSTGHATQCPNFSVAGNYAVTVYDANGCSVVDTVTINEPAPLTAQIVSTTGGLLPDTLSVLASGGTSPYNYSWSGGQTSQIIVATISGYWSVTVTDAIGCIQTDTFSVGCLDICVWPGDTDNNGIADNNDLLPIGLAYGVTGHARPQQDIDWYGHDSQDWDDSLSAPGINAKHIDCNGDGIVNSTDTLAIIQNFGLTHSKNSSRKEWRMNAPALYVHLLSDTVLAGDTVYANLTLGDINIPADDIYGLAFTLNYDPLTVDSSQTNITFGDSWLGSATDKISIAKNVAQNGELKCAITRIDHTTRSGYGLIGQASFIITTDNINGKNELAYHGMNVWISDLTVIDNSGQILVVNEGSDSIQVEFEPVSVANKQLEAGSFNIYPNPANGEEVWLSVRDNLLGGEMKLFDMEGSILLTRTITTANDKLETSGFANGIYLIQVVTEKTVLTKRLVVGRFGR